MDNRYELGPVTAAGNNGVDIDHFPFYPASYDVDNVVSVAAIASDESIAYFSNDGMKNCDLAAPGVGIIISLPKNRLIQT